MSSIGTTPPNRTVSESIGDHDRRSFPERVGGLIETELAADQPAEVGEVLDDALRLHHQREQDADTEQHGQQFGGQSELLVEDLREHPQEERGDDRAPQVVDATEQDDGEQHDRLLDGELVGGHAVGGGDDATGDAGDGCREGECPELVERGVDAGRDGGELGLAERRPGAPGLALDVPGRQR